MKLSVLAALAALSCGSEAFSPPMMLRMTMPRKGYVKKTCSVSKLAMNSTPLSPEAEWRPKTKRSYIPPAASGRKQESSAFPPDAPNFEGNTIFHWSEDLGCEGWALVLPNLARMQDELHEVQQRCSELVTEVRVHFSLIIEKVLGICFLFSVLRRDCVSLLLTMSCLSEPLMLEFQYVTRSKH